jgi:hypothetical protein
MPFTFQERRVSFTMTYNTLLGKNFKSLFMKPGQVYIALVTKKVDKRYPKAGQKVDKIALSRTLQNAKLGEGKSWRLQIGTCDLFSES